MNTTLPEIIVPQTAYVANMRALYEQEPRLAYRIDQVDELDFIPSEPSRNGALTCKVIGTRGEPVYLHSRYDPQREANCWADGALKQAQQQQDRENGWVPMCYIVDGFGLGYHVKALYDRLQGDAFIVVSEPNTALLRTALEHIDYAQMLAGNRVIIINHAERDEIFKKLQAHSHKMMMGMVFTQPLQRIENDFHVVVHKLVSEYAAFLRTTLITMLGNSVRTCRNLLHNLPTYVATESIDILRNRFAGYPAVVVSAGPSLGRNIAILKDIRERVVVIAVQTTLKPLLGAGIVPDFVTSLDYHEVSRRFFEGLQEKDLKSVHLVAEPKAHWHVIDYYRERGVVSLLGNDFARLILRGKEYEHDNLPAGSTVAHLAFYLAQYMGANPIIFVGQDLAFTDNVYYSPGTALHNVWKPELNRFCTIEMKEWERIVRNRGILREVKDIHGRKIYTDEQMFTYLQQFEKDFAESAAEVIDASEGGARKQFCQTMTLAQAARQYCVKLIEPDRFTYRDRLNRFNSDKLLAARGQVLQRIKDVGELKGIGDETLAIVKEMLELVDDQEALNRRMIRLDELRTKVKQRGQTHQMVSFVSQNAEMFRFRQDRTIDLDNVQGKERQRRQLKRDIGYVSEINQGCERLIEMLKECVARFDADLANDGLKPQPGS